jgi:hypothetical protein
MTLERPMFPPRAVGCEIIQISAFTRPARPVSDNHPPAEATTIGSRLLTPRQRRREGKPELPPPATETAKNARIRTERRDAWWLAERVADYWHARFKWRHELETAQRYGIGDSGSFPPAPACPFEAVDTWREAVAKQLLTPAPTLAAVAWKRAKIKSDEFNRLPITLARAEQAIADDLAFLAAHPTRRSNSEAMARSREFKEAMRQRIREIATSRDLSDEEIKPVLRLKHQRVAEFVDKYGVNFEWLYEGSGRIFEKDPIRLVPNMSGGELAAVVTTLPMPDQQAISTMVRELLQERDQ